jgi:two-component system response regulator
MSDKKIMLIGDDPDEQVMNLHTLKNNGIGDDVVVARDGVEILDYLFEATGTPGERICCSSCC